MKAKTDSTSSEARRRYKLWLVGGGTGGHITPLLAVADVLRHSPSFDLAFVGEIDGPEHKLARQSGLRFYGITSGKLRRYITLSSVVLNLRDAWRLWRGYGMAKRLILRHKPDLIFAKGGYVALPVAMAAQRMGVPYIIHESDAVMGRTNLRLASGAELVLTAFPAIHYRNVSPSKLMPVGIPIRSDLLRHRHVRTLNRPMILVTGGIQGALAINRAVAASLPSLLLRASVVHITGAMSYDEMTAVKAQLPPDLQEHYVVMPYTHEMADLMHEATVIVTRAGASTLFEIATVGKPVVVVPLPSAANQHQRANARVFAAARAAIVVDQEELTSERLTEVLDELLDHRELRCELSRNIHQFACDRSAQMVAKLLKERIDKK